jgi:NAD(P)-dependent dehydrogenase (short-subunit alcohol dehydrogenase family)
VIADAAGDYDVTSQIHNDTYPDIDPRSLDLSGKAVFITGGSRGLGRAMALSFAKAGVSKIAIGARSALDDVADEIRKQCSNPREILTIKMDVTDEASVAAAAAEVEQRFGKLNVLINNAGTMGPYGLITDSDPEMWWQVLNTNIRGPYLVTRAFLPLLLGTEGEEKYIVNVCSVAAHLTNPTLSAYQVAKNGLLKFTTLTNAEYSAQGVIAFAIHPGNVPTDIIGGPEAIPPHHKHGMGHFLSAHQSAWLTSFPCSVCRDTRAEWRLGCIFGLEKTGMARWKVHQLHVGPSRAHVEGG